MSKSKACLATATAAVVGLSGVVAIIRAGTPAQAAAAVPNGPNPGTAALTSGWRIQSSAVAGHDGAKISKPGYRATGWLPLSKPETLMAGLLENGRYPNVFHGDNLAKVPTEQFKVNWWYREQITVHPRPGHHTFLTMNGINGDADLWVNGRKIADRSRLRGSYSRFEFDITPYVRNGANAIALDVAKNEDEFNSDPSKPAGKHLTLNMVDWNPPSPDRYTGLQSAPQLAQNGPVSVRDAHVVQHNAKDLSTSDLTVKASLRNNTGEPRRAVFSGSISRGQTRIPFTKTVALAPHETRTVTVTPADDRGLHLAHPDIWWPYQMGGQPMYHLQVAADVDGGRSDQDGDDFGIRTVTSRLTRVVPGKTHGAGGYRQFLVNGVPFVVRGGGWSQDMFLRYSSRNIADQLAYVKNMGLNALRFEGNFPPDDMFAQLDRAGILAMTGWQCCDRWEDDTSTWDAATKENAANQASHMAARLRSHPSVFTFFLGSDYAPDATKEGIYLDAFHAADWDTPLVPSAWYQSSPKLGPSGSKEGSYNYAPPSYWWANGPETVNAAVPGRMFLFNGSAWGFEAEASAGNTIPTQDSLDRFLTKADQKKIWDPATAQGPGAGADLFHTSAYTEYYKLARMGVYNTALWKRYGPWSDAAGYQKTVQLGEYEVARAQFEAYIGNSTDPANPSTGVIYWMLNKAWPSLQWSLYGYDFDQPGVYFGAKKANEPVHIMYSYKDGSIQVANLTNTPQAGLRATVEFVDINGTVRGKQTVPLSALARQEVRTALRPKVPAGISRTYFAKLTLSRGSTQVSRNVYWLSTKADRVDWKSTHAGFQGYANFEQDGYADLSGLRALGDASVKVTAHTRREGADAVTTVTVRNIGGGHTPALFTRADLFAGGHQVLPIRWSDNNITLWPGEEQTITARYRADAAPVVRLSGYNLKTQQINAG